MRKIIQISLALAVVGIAVPVTAQETECMFGKGHLITSINKINGKYPTLQEAIAHNFRNNRDKDLTEKVLVYFGYGPKNPGRDMVLGPGVVTCIQQSPTILERLKKMTLSEVKKERGL